MDETQPTPIEPTPEQPDVPGFSTGVAGILAVMALGALGISTFLLIATWQGGPIPGCGPDSAFGCDKVLTSRWSRWFDLPVSLPALVVDLLFLYFLAMVVRARNAADRRHAWGMLLLLGAVLLGAGVWFIALQAVVIKAYCQYCLVAHSLGILIGLTVFFICPPEIPTTPRLAWACAAMVVLVGVQIVHKSDTMKIAKGHSIALANGQVRLNPEDFPIIGDPFAEYVFIYLFDYTCPHCHEQAHNLKLARRRYGDQLAIIKLPVPLDSRCNRTVTETRDIHKTACDLAKLALSVFRADPTKFAEYDAFMFAAGKSRPVEEARAEAERLVGVETLDKALADPWVQSTIDKNIGLYELSSGWANHRAIPQIITGPLIIAGQPGSAEEFFDLLEKEVGILPVNDLPPDASPEMPPLPTSITIPPDEHDTGSQNPPDGGSGNTR